MISQPLPCVRQTPAALIAVIAPGAARPPVASSDRLAKHAGGRRLAGDSAGSGRRHLAAEIRPVLARLGEIADQYLPLGTPREAVDYVLGHATGFGLSSVAEYCGADEREGDRLVNELQRLLAGEVRAGRLVISYLSGCPPCGNVINSRDDLSEGPFQVFCEHGNCRAERTVDPARADAVFINANRDPGLKSWL